MRNAILVSILTVVLVVSASAVFAGAPLNGTWKSTNGDFDEGTATTHGGLFIQWVTTYARSFAGGVFTDDWTIACVKLMFATLIVPKAGPTGNEIWQFTYSPSDGYVTLGGPGNPWNGGDAVYTGIIDSYTEIRTVQYVNNIIVGSVSDHAISAHIQGYPESCVSWAIGNGVLRGGIPGYNEPAYGAPLQGAKGSGYPGWADYQISSTCEGGLVDAPYSPYGGHWDDIRDLTLSITGCTVATQPSTWGAVKAMYRN